MNSVTAHAASISISTTNIMTDGPTCSNSCPISQGTDITPMLTPTRKQLVTRPVIAIRRDANVIVVGKSEAIARPKPIAPIHRAGSDCGQRMMIATLITQPSRSPIRIARGRVRVAIGIASSRPAVSAPQKPAVRYAAVASSASPSAWA